MKEIVMRTKKETKMNPKTNVSTAAQLPALVAIASDVAASILTDAKRPASERQEARDYLAKIDPSRLGNIDRIAARSGGAPPGAGPVIQTGARIGTRTMTAAEARAEIARRGKEVA